MIFNTIRQQCHWKVAEQLPRKQHFFSVLARFHTLIIKDIDPTLGGLLGENDAGIAQTSEAKRTVIAFGQLGCQPGNDDTLQSPR